MGSLTDGRGCLTEAGFLAVERAALGRAPSELSTHLASCSRCQDRLLQRSTGASGRRALRKPPPLWRIALVLAAALLMTAVALFGVRWLGR